MNGQYKSGEEVKDEDLEEEYEGPEKQGEEEFYDTGEGDEGKDQNKEEAFGRLYERRG